VQYTTYLVDEVKKTDMKRVLLLIAVVILGLNATAQEKIKWYSIEEAIQLASQEPRIIVIDVFTDWCGWCKRMDATTFEDPEVVEMMNNDFYPVKLNAEGKDDIVIGERTFKFVDNGRRGYHEMAAIVTRGRLSYPTISYIDSQGKVLEAAPGYKSADQFRIYLAYYSDGAYKNQTFDDFSARSTAEAKSVIESL
jgi:thioredoxin-related protein